MNLVVLGPQGSGKGSQAKRLIDKYSLAYVEMGEICRKVIKEDSPLGSKVNEFVNVQGKLVPDEIIFEIMNNFLKNIGRLDGILFDGFPRIIFQSKYLDDFLKEREKKIDLVIYLTLKREESIRRLTSRRVCEKCGAIYNLLTQPPKLLSLCDSCGGKLITRADESPEKINARLDEFERQTLPLIEYYKKRGILEEVDGNRPIEPITEDIFSRIAKRGLV